MLTPGNLAAVLAAALAQLRDPGTQAEQEATGRAITATRRSITALVDAIEAGGGPTVIERLRVREADLRRLELQAEDLARREEFAAALDNPAIVERVIAEMRGQVEGESVADVRHALGRLVERVDVWRERVRITFAGVDLAVIAGIGEVPPSGRILIPAKWHVPIDTSYVL